MHMLITLYTFPYPPHTVGPFNGQGLPQQYAGVGTIQDYRGMQVPPFYTNGAGLVSEQGLDQRLRNLLMRCLAVTPADRPGLEELEAWAGQAESNPGFFAAIGGDLSTTDLADHFICRPREVSATFAILLDCLGNLAKRGFLVGSPLRPQYKWPSQW